MVFDELKKCIQNTDKKELSKQLGYVREVNFSRALFNLERASSLDNFFGHGHFDWCHSSKTLILEIGKFFGLDILSDLDASSKLREEKEANNLTVKILTDFKAKNEPILELKMLTDLQYISLYTLIDELCFKTKNEKLRIIGKFLANHTKAKPRLPVFGRIVGYEVEISGESFVFDICGKVKP